MNREWSETLKNADGLLRKKESFDEGIQELLELRNSLFGQIGMILNGFPEYAFSEQPFPNANGYHSKTLAYSIWHIFRIEDITANSLIRKTEQVLFREGYTERIGADRVTTGNELQGTEIVKFSEKLDVKALYAYAGEVKASADELLKSLSFEDMKRSFSPEEKAELDALGCVSKDENAHWLIDYWCGKNVLGLLKMPFSRHWIMHVEAMLRIKNRLCVIARKGADPIAYCGFSCNHCFLGAWCGSCRTPYNTCSFATLFEDKKCPNMVCCQEKGLDGCYECDEIAACTKGFYGPESDGAHAAKAQALYIRKHGKKAFLKVQDRLHEQYDFAKTQEILGQDTEGGLRILEQVLLM